MKNCPAILLVILVAQCPLSAESKLILKNGIPKHKPQSSKSNEAYVRTFGSYFAECGIMIKRIWTTTERSEISSLKNVAIAVKVDDKGNVVKTSVAKSSGSKSIDGKALCVTKSAIDGITPPPSYFAYKRGIFVEYLAKEPWVQIRFLDSTDIKESWRFLPACQTRNGK